MRMTKRIVRKLIRADRYELQFISLNDQAIKPTRAHDSDAGLDLHCIEDIEVHAGCGAMVKTGIAIALPEGTYGRIAGRSSLGSKGINVHGGVIDFLYRGELIVCLWNNNKEGSFKIQKGKAVAQLIISPILTPVAIEVHRLTDTTRGNKGFGSSGK